MVTKERRQRAITTVRVTWGIIFSGLVAYAIVATPHRVWYVFLVLFVCWLILMVVVFSFKDEEE